jgi:CBS domain-containing protein
MRPVALTVKDVMVKDVITTSPNAPLSEAVGRLADGRVGGLAVTDSHHRIIGVLSATDILTAEAEAQDDEARARLLSTATVRDVMSTHPLVVSPETELREAALQMDYADVHRLFVTVGGVLVGVISRSDINHVFATKR